MKLFSRKDQKGFTIIEVMIVLAIAGLIIGVVLVAVPQLQRNQRNTARKSILNRVKTELENYAGNNNGTYPANATGDNAGNFGEFATESKSFVGRYLKGVNVKDPKTGSDVTFAVSAGGAAFDALPSEGQVLYYYGAICNTDGAMQVKTGRFYAVSIGLEGGAAQCLDNQ